jgi:hypothetical protein
MMGVAPRGAARQGNAVMANPTTPTPDPGHAFGDGSDLDAAVDTLLANPHPAVVGEHRALTTETTTPAPARSIGSASVPRSNHEHGAATGAAALEAVETVDQMLADVAAELAGTDESEVNDPPVAGTESTPPADTTALLDQVREDLGEGRAGATEPGLPFGAPPSPAAADPGAIDQLDEVLAESAEKVLADSDTQTPAALVPDAPAPTPPQAAAAVPAAQPAGVVARPAAAPTPQGEQGAAVPVEPARVRPPRGSVIVRVLGPLAEKTAGCSTTMRQTISWMAVYTSLLAVGVWAFLLMRGPDKPFEPVSDPTPFLKPGEQAPPEHHRKEPAGGKGEHPPASGGHGESGGESEPHKPAKNEVKAKAGGHGAAAKSAQATDKKKPPASASAHH